MIGGYDKKHVFHYTPLYYFLSVIQLQLKTCGIFYVEYIYNFYDDTLLLNAVANTILNTLY